MEFMWMMCLCVVLPALCFGFLELDPREIHELALEHVNLTSDPHEIASGGDNFRILCSLTSRTGAYRSVESILLAKWDSSSAEFQELARINSANPDEPEQVTKSNFKVTGQIQSTSTSSLEIKWDLGSADEEGSYICSADVLDPAGRVLNLTVTLHVDMQEVTTPKPPPPVRVEFCSARGKCVREYIQYDVPSASRSRCYKERMDQETWSDAKIKCMAAGGRLAEIHDLDTMEFLRKNARATLRSAVWLGARDNLREGTFKWESGPYLTVKKWARGEPSNYYNPVLRVDQDCLVLNRVDGLMEDGHCVQTYNVLCETEQDVKCSKWMK